MNKIKTINDDGVKVTSAVTSRNERLRILEDRYIVYAKLHNHRWKLTYIDNLTREIMFFDPTRSIRHYNRQMEPKQVKSMRRILKNEYKRHGMDCPPTSTEDEAKREIKISIFSTSETTSLESFFKFNIFVEGFL